MTQPPPSPSGASRTTPATSSEPWGSGTLATRSRSSTPSLGRRFRGAGSAASFSLASSPWRTPGVRSRSAPGPARIRRADTSWSWPMGGGIRPAGPSAPPGVLILIYKISWKNSWAGGRLLGFRRPPGRLLCRMLGPNPRRDGNANSTNRMDSPPEPSKALGGDSGPHLRAASGGAYAAGEAAPSGSITIAFGASIPASRKASQARFVTSDSNLNSYLRSLT